MKTIVAPARLTAATTSASRFEPPGWMIAAHAGLEREPRAVREREERVGRERRAVEVVAELPRLLDRDPHRVDAAHLAGADADRPQVLGDHDRVRGDVLADAPGEEQVAPVGLAGLAADDDHPLAVLDVAVAVLGEQAADHAPVVALARRRVPPLGRVEDPQRLLRAQRLERARPRTRARTAPRRTARRAARRARRDTGRLRTTTPPYAETGSEPSARAYASSIAPATATPHGFACLTITQAGSVNSSTSCRAAREVVEVVVRELLAAELLDAREQVAARARLGVVGGPLVRVLAVGEVALLPEGRDQPLRERLAVGEPRGDRRLVRGRDDERLGGERAARVQRELAVLAQLGEHGLVALGPRDRRPRARSSSPRRAAAPARRCRSSRPPPPRVTPRREAISVKG